MATLRTKSLTFDREYLRKLRDLAERIPDDAGESDADLKTFVRHYEVHGWDLMQAGLALGCYTVYGGGLLIGPGQVPREIREKTLVWLAVQRG